MIHPDLIKGAKKSISPLKSTSVINLKFLTITFG